MHGIVVYICSRASWTIRVTCTNNWTKKQEASQWQASFNTGIFVFPVYSLNLAPSSRLTHCSRRYSDLATGGDCETWQPPFWFYCTVLYLAQARHSLFTVCFCLDCLHRLGHSWLEVSHLSSLALDLACCTFILCLECSGNCLHTFQARRVTSSNAQIVFRTVNKKIYIHVILYIFLIFSEHMFFFFSAVSTDFGVLTTHLQFTVIIDKSDI